MIILINLTSTAEDVFLILPMTTLLWIKVICSAYFAQTFNAIEVAKKLFVILRRSKGLSRWRHWEKSFWILISGKYSRGKPKRKRQILKWRLLLSCLIKSFSDLIVKPFNFEKLCKFVLLEL